MHKLRRVLLIDDDATTNYVNERIVKGLQITEEVKVLTDGRQGLDYLTARCGGGSQETCPELIILDHHMPVMDGMELIETLHQAGTLERMETVFLLLAVHTSPADLAKFQELGVQEFTPKPLSRERLLEAYRKYWTGDTVQDHTPPSSGKE